MRRQQIIAPLVGFALLLPIRATSTSDDVAASRRPIPLGSAEGADARSHAGAAGDAVPVPLGSAAMAASRGGSGCSSRTPMYEVKCRMLRLIRKYFRWVRSVAGGGSYLWSSAESMEESVLSEEHDASLPYSYTEYYNDDHVRDEYYETEADAAAGAYWGSSQSNSGMYYSHTVYTGGGGGGGGGCETGYDPY